MIHIFYHKDFDGFCSGAIVYNHFLINCPAQEIELHEINYGWPFPWDEIQKGDLVYMVDFCLSDIKDMVKLNESCYKLVWIDHHISALKSAEEIGLTLPGLQEVSKAGCELTWEYFYPNIEIPRAVYYLGRYDVWAHEECPEALPFQYGMGMIKRNPDHEDWPVLLSKRTDLTEKILEEGRLLVTYQKRQYEIICGSTYTEVEFAGLPAIAANSPVRNSFLFEKYYDREKHKIMIVYAWSAKGGCWTVSLYSDHDDVDCSVLAKERGGGGHKGAAGFQTDDVSTFTVKRSE